MGTLKLAFLLTILLVGSFTLNVYIHEYGHFLAAKHYDLQPEIHFEEPVSTGNKFSFFTPRAFTSYISDTQEITAEDAVIAFAGPLVNLAFALFVTAIYFLIPKRKRTFAVQTALAMIAIPAYISFIINLLPMGYSDGTIIIEFLSKL